MTLTAHAADHRLVAASHHEARPLVLHVLHTLNMGGAEVLVRDMIADLRDRYRFLVVSLDDDGPLHAELCRLGAEVHVLHRKPGFDLSVVRRIAGLVRRREVSVIHAHQYTPFVYAGIARLMGGWQSKLIFTEHGRHYPDRRRFKRVLANQMLLTALAHRITAVGRFVRHALVDNEAMPAKRIRVIYNGVRTDRFAPDAQRRTAMRRELGLSDDQPVICQVGGFRPVKDHRTAIRALRALHLLGCPATLLLVGDGPCLGDARAEATLCRVEGSVKFLGRREDVADLWQAADVAMLTSRSEGISVALLEAMATGVPVVATDVGGNREIVHQDVTGLLAPRGHPAAIAEALHRVLTNPELRRRLGQASRRRVIERFEKQTMHRAYARLYQDLSHALAPATARVR